MEKIDILLMLPSNKICLDTFIKMAVSHFNARVLDTYFCTENCAFMRYTTDFYKAFNDMNGQPTEINSKNIVFKQIIKDTKELLKLDNPKIKSKTKDPKHIVEIPNWENLFGSIFPTIKIGSFCSGSIEYFYYTI